MSCCHIKKKDSSTRKLSCVCHRLPLLEFLSFVSGLLFLPAESLALSLCPLSSCFAFLAAVYAYRKCKVIARYMHHLTD